MHLFLLAWLSGEVRVGAVFAVCIYCTYAIDSCNLLYNLSSTFVLVCGKWLQFLTFYGSFFKKYKSKEVKVHNSKLWNSGETKSHYFNFSFPAKIGVTSMTQLN